MAALVGEVQERRGGVWRTVHLGERVRVNDRRRVDFRIHADISPLMAATLAMHARRWAT